MRVVLPLICLALSGCVVTTVDTTSPTAPSRTSSVAPGPSKVASRNFNSVVKRVEPVAESICRRRTSGANCDFRILVHPDARQPSNAYQTLDKSGVPVIVFTQALIAETQNNDELAFVLGHEAAHHIRGHIPKQQQSATAGALLATVGASILGAGQAGVDVAQQLGATVGARAFSKDMELEADSLGTVIAARAGYDPILGAKYFDRIPDPGDQFLGSHPPNKERQKTVRRVAKGL
ncbi:M48 family metalloprotease [Actibacterium lipolyticum]|uniref:TPR repeat-containing protein YfgC n=1 Tax=Actibacterium lipolyticum TaxID=1524263 RepID=A0A238JMV6_9RHOB|nr:M48 family metalloprotease [Actibacterium lipolyticum]SMX31825.1 TPR repeat-containing protein YfgC precursor [Actibacterium lipolyticum]